MEKKSESYQEQIERFYKNNLQKYEQIKMGDTPEYLISCGAEKLPVILNQSVLRKIVREPSGSRSAHALTKEFVELMPRILSSPALLIKGTDMKRIALLSEQVSKQGNPMLLALELREREYNKVTSFYGKENCKAYLERQKNVIIIDNEKAKQLSRLLGFQLPMAWKVLDYTYTISENDRNVKPADEKKIRAPAEIVKDIRQSGFQATKSLIRNIRQLDGLTGRTNTLKDISAASRQGCPGRQPEEKELTRKIVEECRQQELAKLQLPER